LKGGSRGVDLDGISEDSSAEDLIAWSLERFGHLNRVITTSFGMEGCALIDMVARQSLLAGKHRPQKIVYLDTMFFFDQTYALRDKLMQRYPHLEFVNMGTALTPQQQQERYGPQLWKTDPNLCCRIRKVDPMRKVLTGVDLWITGLRRSQSPTRANLPVLGWDWRFQLMKLNVLAKWERSDVWEYIKANDVPYNELHEQGYPTIGCTYCTNPVDGVAIGEYSRAGRWSDFKKTECGLHGGEGI